MLSFLASNIEKNKLFLLETFDLAYFFKKEKNNNEIRHFKLLSSGLLAFF